MVAAARGEERNGSGGIELDRARMYRVVLPIAGELDLWFASGT